MQYFRFYCFYPWLVVAAFAVMLIYPSLVTAKCSLTEECITDYDQSQCPAGQYLTANTTVSGCCPGCKAFVAPGNLCSSGNDRICAPGLKCVSRYCVIDYATCVHPMHLPADKKPIYPPSCDSDGSFSPVQCKGDKLVGRCFCSNILGERIFGMTWAKDSQNMTCACSRRRADLEALGRTDVTLHCASNGNYEPLQCDSGLCWCAEHKTGETESMVVSEELVSMLPCYDEDKYGSQYLRKCESKSYAIAVLMKKLALHGVGQVTMASPNCDYDGTYGVYQIENGIAYCSWKDGGRIGPYQSEAGASLSSVNCNCARDMKYFEEMGTTMSQTCKGNGNYLAVQQLDGRLYCVDDDGFAITDLKPLGEQLDCGAW